MRNTFLKKTYIRIWLQLDRLHGQMEKKLFVLMRPKWSSLAVKQNKSPRTHHPHNEARCWQHYVKFSVTNIEKY